MIHQSACRAGYRNLGSRGSHPKVVRRINDYSGGIRYAVNICMRTTTCSALVLSIALLAAAPLSILAATPDHAGLREMKIPFALEPRELAMDATASAIEPRSRRLADVTILSLHDRTVKLRFTMTGVPLPPFSATCTPSHALVSVRVNILTSARPH